MGIKIYKNDALIKEPTIYHLPQLINLKCQCEDTLLNANCIPIKAGTGSRHTILIMNCGSVYVAGWNVHGQIGSKEINSYCDVFKYVYKVNSSNIEDIEIACGNWCTLIGILWKITCYVCIMKMYEQKIFYGIFVNNCYMTKQKSTFSVIYLPTVKRINICL